MAASQSSFDMTAYKHSADKDMAGVMPEHWVGHARIAAYEATEGLSAEARRVAREKAHAIASTKRVSAATVGEAALMYVKKHID